MRPTATSPSQCPSSKYGSHERATPRRRHRVQGGAKPPAHGMWDLGTLCPFASAPQRPAQASALSAPAGARVAERGARARAPDETRRGGTRDGRVEAGSITFLIRFSIIIFSILKSIFMRTLNRRARRAAVRGAEWRLPPATDIRVSPRSPRPRIFTSRHEGCPPRRACATSFAGGVVAR